MPIFAYLFPLLGYLCGSIPIAYIYGKMHGIDIRKHGSGNVGATNALRTLGRKAGIVVLALDVAKVLVVLLLGQFLHLDRNILLLTGGAAFIGHNWSIFLHFKGGKGVAVSAGILFYFFPLPGMVSISLFILIVAVTKYVSLGSLLAAGITPLMLALFGYPDLEIAFAGVIAAIIIWAHRENIARLRYGRESKISLGR